MTASAERIDFVSHTARNVAHAGGQSSVLTVNFNVFRRGPAHVSGLSYTSDFWACASGASRAAIVSPRVPATIRLLIGVSP